MNWSSTSEGHSEVNFLPRQNYSLLFVRVTSGERRSQPSLSYKRRFQKKTFKEDLKFPFLTLTRHSDRNSSTLRLCRKSSLSATSELWSQRPASSRDLANYFSGSLVTAINTVLRFESPHLASSHQLIQSFLRLGNSFQVNTWIIASLVLFFIHFSSKAFANRYTLWELQKRPLTDDRSRPRVTLYRAHLAPPTSRLGCRLHVSSVNG